MELIDWMTLLRSYKTLLGCLDCMDLSQFQEKWGTFLNRIV